MEQWIAVAVIIAVEEAVFLLAVQRIERRIQIEDDLPSGRVGLLRLSSSRFSVDLPVSGAQSARCAASLAVSTASTGSCRPREGLVLDGREHDGRLVCVGIDRRRLMPTLVIDR